MHLSSKIFLSLMLSATLTFPAMAEETSGREKLEQIFQKSKEAVADTVNSIEPSAASTFSFGDSSISAKPGECYGQVTTPAVTRTESQQIEVAPASKQIAKIIPATYKTISEEIVVKEAGEELIVIPATYKTVTEEITVQPESKRIVKVPAKFETKTEQVLVRPARTVWKKGTSSPITKVNERGEVMCLVEEPAEYKTISKQVLVTPESTKEEIIPAVTKVIEKKVVDQPARTEKRAIPAVTKTISKKVLEKPEEIQYQETPAQFKTVSHEVVVNPEKTEWKKILCQTNANDTNVRALQNALKKAGFNPGNIDGVLGYQTYQAVDSFQRSKGLSRGEITYDTLEALGLAI